MEDTNVKIKNWFSTEAKNDNGFYRLYTVKFANSTPNRKDLRATNFITDNIQDSLTKLDTDIKIHGDTSQQFFAILHVESKKDPHPIVLIVENPYYNTNFQKGSTFSSINGINNNNNSSYNAQIGMISMMKEHHESTSMLQQEMQQLRHEHEVEKMDSRISDLEYSQKTSVDRIGEFFQTDVGQQIVGGITQLVSQKMSQQPAQQPVQPTEQTIKNTSAQQQPAQKSDNPQAQKLNDSLMKLDKVFRGEGLEALNELADFCVKNPILAKQFRKQSENE